MTVTRWRTADVVSIAPAATSDGRTLTVQLAPWGQSATVDDGDGPYSESLARGALVPPDPPRTVPVFAGHDPVTRARGPLIGRVAEFDDRDDGLYGQLRIADSAAGRDALALLADEIVTGVSVEFTDPAPQRARAARPAAAVTRSGPLPLVGVALVVNPAYLSARVLSVRSEVPAMPTELLDSDLPDPAPEPEPEPEPEPTAMRAEVARRAAARESAPVPAGRAGVELVGSGPRYRSYGEFVADTARAAMRGEVPEFAQLVYRALADEVTADVPGLVREAWLPGVKGLLELARPAVQAFTTSPLPAGDPIAWAEITDLPPVGVQATEKAEVVSGKLLVAKRTADIVTYGGGQDISMQVITRSQPSYIDTVMQAYAKQMAVEMNAGALGAIDAGLVHPIVDLGATPATWVANLAHADALVFQSVYVPPDRLVAGLGIREQFLAATDADGRPLFGGISPFNNVGTLSLGSEAGNVRGMTVVFDPTLPPLVGYLGWSGAFNTYLSPIGNLQVDNPRQLGRDVAVYQMAAFALFYPAGIVKLTMPAPVPDPGAARSSSRKS